MIENYAEVVDGVVVNVFLWDGVTPAQYRGEVIKLEEGVVAGPKWLYANGVFSEPPQLAPEE